MRNLCVWVPDDLYSKFKIQIIKDNTTIKGAVLTLLAMYVGEEKNGDNQKGEKNNGKQNVEADKKERE